MASFIRAGTSAGDADAPSFYGVAFRFLTGGVASGGVRLPETCFFFQYGCRDNFDTRPAGKTKRP